MKYLFILAMLLAGNTQAREIDLGLGYTWTETPHNGRWHQDPFKKDIKSNSPSWHVGLRFNVYENIEILAGYKYLGSFSSNALASSSDINYRQWQDGTAEIWPLTTWKGKGEADGFYLLAQYNFKHFHIKAGRWIHRSTWSVDIPDWRCATKDGRKCVADYPYANYSAPKSKTVEAEESYVAKNVFGIGKRFGPISIDYEIWVTDSDSDKYPSAYKGDSQNLSITYIY